MKMANGLWVLQPLSLPSRFLHMAWILDTQLRLARRELVIVGVRDGLGDGLADGLAPSLAEAVELGTQGGLGAPFLQCSAHERIDSASRCYLTSPGHLGTVASGLWHSPCDGRFPAPGPFFLL